MRFCKRALLILLVWLTLVTVLWTTTTQFNLTVQVQGVLPIANGGTNGGTAAAALINLLPTASEVGDLIYCSTFSSGACTAWSILKGNTSGTAWLQETSSGAPSWTAPSGTGTVTDGSGTTTANEVVLSTGTAHVIGYDTILTDNGTTLSYTGTSGLSTPQVATTGTGPFSFSSTPGSCGTSASGAGLLCWSSTGNRLAYGYNGGTNYNLLLASDAVAMYNAAQTWSAAQTFPTSDIILGGSGAGTTTFASANSSGTSYTATFPAATNYVLEGDISSSGGTPRLQVSVYDCGSGSCPAADTTSNVLGGLYVTKAVTVQAARIFVEKTASSCTTEPKYELYYNTSFSTSSATAIGTTTCSPTLTSIGSTSCSITATSVPAGDYVFWEVNTAASSCSGLVHLVYEYTMN